MSLATVNTDAVELLALFPSSSNNCTPKHCRAFAAAVALSLVYMLHISAPALPQFTWGPNNLAAVPSPAATTKDADAAKILADGIDALKMQLEDGATNQKPERVALQFEAESEKLVLLTLLLKRLNRVELACNAHSSEMLNSNRVLEQSSAELEL